MRATGLSCGQPVDKAEPPWPAVVCGISNFCKTGHMTAPFIAPIVTIYLVLGGIYWNSGVGIIMRLWVVALFAAHVMTTQ